jgi:hypothetical protein
LIQRRVRHAARDHHQCKLKRMRQAKAIHPKHCDTPATPTTPPIRADQNGPPDDELWGSLVINEDTLLFDQWF